MNALTGQYGELRMTLLVTRAATGKTETFELVGRVDASELEAPAAEAEPPQAGAEAQKD